MNAIIDDIIRREGGFVNHPSDRGGATKYGVTQHTLSAWLGRKASVSDVRELSESEARKIYQHNYIDLPNFKYINNPRLRNLVVDCAVNHGARRAAKFLQKAAGVKADGYIGNITLHAVNSMDGDSLFRKVLALRIMFFGRIITRNPSQAVFAQGWMKRVAEFIV